MSNYFCFNKDLNTFLELDDHSRLRHMHICGTQSYYKNRLIQSLIEKDIQNKNGVILFDMNGDISDKLHFFNREDITFINISNSLNDFYINPHDICLYDERRKEIEEILSADFFRHFFEAVVENKIEKENFSSFEKVMFDMISKGNISSYSFLESVRKKELRLKLIQIWDDINRFESFINGNKLFSIFQKNKSSISLSEPINRGEVLIFRFVDKDIDKKNKNLIVMILLHIVQMSLMRRIFLESIYRIPTFVYFNGINDFFTPDSINNIRTFGELLSEARLYKAGFIINHEHISELVFENNYFLQTCILNNCASTVTFKTEEDDASFFEKLYYDSYKKEGYKKEDVLSLKENQFISRVLTKEGIQSIPFIGEVIR